MSDKKHQDVTKLSFEDALKELEGIISQLEGGDVPLEQSIDLYERGAALRGHCEKTLGAARERIEKIVDTEDGGQKTEPASFD